MGFTQQQQDAIDTRGKTVLVSAAAGSGKTFTLTQRIINKVIGDGNVGADISRMLIVTFTRAAAGELKEKIYKKLSEEVAADPKNERLQKQLLTLGGAKICTIDSFLSDPVRSNFDKLGLPPSLRLADGAEMDDLSQDTMRSVLDEMYEKYLVCTDKSLARTDFSSDFTDLISVITSAKKSSEIYKNLFSLYNKLITSPRGCKQLSDFSHRLAENAKMDFFETPEGKIIQNHILILTEHLILTIDKCIEYISSDPDMLHNYADLMEKYSNWFKRLYSETKKGYADAQAAFQNPDKLRAPTVKNKTPECEFVLEKIIPSLKNEIKKTAKDYLSQSPEEIALQYSATAKNCGVLYEILSEFDRRYTEEKISRGVVEFSDMPRFMLKLLLNPDGSPTDAAKALSESFDEVYIDEYQDVNEIQDKIFEIIGQNRRFMVGDIKQSIYGFREAEPSLFAGYRKKFPIYGSEEEKTSEGCTIFMSDNFRCDESVIKFTNLLCSEIFSACPDSIGYKDEDNLRLSKNEPRGHFPVVVNLIQKPDKDDTSDGVDGDSDDEDDSFNGALEDEAIITANEISYLLHHGIRADGERIAPKDIAVLVSTKNSAKPLADALDRLGISYTLPTKSKLLDGEAMKNLFNLLEIIDNPRSDVPLCNLITAPIAGTPLFTVEEVITIRKAAEDSKSLYDAIIEYASHSDSPVATLLCHRCEEFVRKTENLRLLSMRMPADKILRTISADPYFSAMCDNAAFTYIYDSARRYTQNSYSGLYSFIDYFRCIMENGDNSITEPDAEDDNAVTFMTIHQSKGLEFNTCFLFNMGKQFNFEDAKSSIVFDRHLCAATKILKYPDKDSGVENICPEKKNTVIRTALALNSKQKQIEEKMRLLYVALTRARERLYISLRLGCSYESAMRRSILTGSDSFSIKTANKFTPWIVSALRKAKSNDLLTLNIYNEGTVTLKSVKSDEMAEIMPGTSDEGFARYAALINSPGTGGRREAMLSMIPAKAAASKISPDMLDKTVFLPRSPVDEAEKDLTDEDRITEESIKNRIELMRSSHPDFASVIDVNKKPTASERGTAAHAFLQYCDYEHLEKYGVDAEIQRLLDEKFIDERTARIINRKQIGLFSKSDLFSMLRSARSVRREFRFGSFEPAAQFTQNPELAEIVADRKIYVQGSIDLIIENPDGSLYICDYKSDALSADEVSDIDALQASMKAKHENQLKEYCKATEKIFGRAADKVFIYSLPAGRAVRII